MQRRQFPLFQTPVDLAHSYWERLLKKGDCVIDATCGNGHDTLFLAKTVLGNASKGHVTAIDKQPQAIHHTHDLLKNNLSEDELRHVSLYQQCHSSFPDYLKNKSVALIVYNLGYLPGGNKNMTTEASTTEMSLNAALPLIVPGGAISITCYPGHEAGKPEEETVLNFAASLDPRHWSSCFHRWLNREHGPSLILIQCNRDDRDNRDNRKVTG